MTDTRAPVEELREEPASEAPERQTTPFLVLQFFIFPMAIVAACVAVFVIFGLIAAEGKGAREYLSEIRTGSANRRWQAAFELSKVLQARRDSALEDSRFVSEIVSLFEESGKDDPRVRRYLAVALGRLGDRRAVPGLLTALDTARPDTDAETVIYSVWALGSIGDPAAVPHLAKLTKAEERDLRKAAVHALGAFATEEARAALLGALADPIEDVRWNAALALARRGDRQAAPVLLQMMDRHHLATVDGATPDQQEDALLQAVALSAALPDLAVRKALEGLRDGDRSPKVREAARIALEQGRSASP